MSIHEGVESRTLAELLTNAPPPRADARAVKAGALAARENAKPSFEAGQLPGPNAVRFVVKPDRRRQSRERVTAKDIARGAYHLYLMRGCEPGHDVEDWLRAERELRSSEALVPGR